MTQPPDVAETTAVELAVASGGDSEMPDASLEAAAAGPALQGTPPHSAGKPADTVPPSTGKGARRGAREAAALGPLDPQPLQAGPRASRRGKPVVTGAASSPGIPYEQTDPQWMAKFLESAGFTPEEPATEPAAATPAPAVANGHASPPRTAEPAPAAVSPAADDAEAWANLVMQQAKEQAAAGAIAADVPSPLPPAAAAALAAQQAQDQEEQAGKKRKQPEAGPALDYGPVDESYDFSPFVEMARVGGASSWVRAAAAGGAAGAAQAVPLCGHHVGAVQRC